MRANLSNLLAAALLLILSACPRTAAAALVTGTSVTIATSPASVSSSGAELSAVFHGAVTPEGMDARIFFEYGPTASYGSSTPWQDIGSGFSKVSVSATATVPTPVPDGTAYHFRLVASNGLATFYGPDQALTPSFTIGAVVITPSTVSFSGTVNPNGLGWPASRYNNVWVSWQTPVAGNQAIGSGTSGVPVTTTSPLTGRRSVPPGIYHYQLAIWWPQGAIYGPVQVFSVAPPAMTYSAPVTTATDAALSLTVNPNGIDTTAVIQYVSTSGLVSGSTAAVDLGSGFAPVPLNTDFAGLAPNTAYNYRVVTTSALGTLYGPYQLISTQTAFGTAAVVSSGDHAPGILDANFAVLGNPALNESDNAAFQATLSGYSVTKANNSGIWVYSGSNTSTLIAQTGTSAPGHLPGSTVANGTFSGLSDPVLADDNAVAFLGTLAITATSSPQVTATNNSGIWANTSGTTTGPLLLVARTGDPAPDTGGATSASGPVFGSFSQFVLPDQGGVVFLANLNSGSPRTRLAAAVPGPGGVTASNSQGVWGVDTDGLLKQIIRSGDTLSINGGAKVIASLSIFNPPAASAGQTRHFNNAGDLTYEATFTEGSSAIVQSVIP